MILRLIAIVFLKVCLLGNTQILISRHDSLVALLGKFYPNVCKFLSLEQTLDIDIVIIGHYFNNTRRRIRLRSNGVLTLCSCSRWCYKLLFKWFNRKSPVATIVSFPLIIKGSTPYLLLLTHARHLECSSFHCEIYVVQSCTNRLVILSIIRRNHTNKRDSTLATFLFIIVPTEVVCKDILW